MTAAKTEPDRQRGVAEGLLASSRRPSSRLAVALPRLARSSLGFWIFLGICVSTDFYLARSLYPNSDSVQAYNEMLAVRSGNPFLHDWVLATDNFLLTDLPLFVLASFLFGSGPSLIYIVPFLMFVFLLCACLLLVAHATANRRYRLIGGYAILLLLGMPYGLYYDFFFWSDFHVATVTLCLYGILAIAPALSNRRFHRLRLVPFTVLVFAIAFSDPMADGLLLGPVALLVILRAWFDQHLRLDDLLITGCVVLGLLAGLLAVRTMEAMHTFVILPSVTMSFIPDLTSLAANASAMLAGLEVLFTARGGQIDTLPLHGLISLSRLLTAFFVAASSVAIIWRMPRRRDEGVEQLLVLGAACLATLDAMSRTFGMSITGTRLFPGASIRFLVPLFVFTCTSASIGLGPTLARCSTVVRRLLATLVVAAGLLYCLGGVCSLARSVARPPAIRTAPQRLLADWLESHGLHYGVGDYWDTQMVHALSGGVVTADPVTQVDGQVVIFIWLTDAAQGRLKRRPQFAIITPGGVFRVTLAAVEKTYGMPLSVTQVAGHYFVARFKS